MAKILLAIAASAAILSFGMSAADARPHHKGYHGNNGHHYGWSKKHPRRHHGWSHRRY